MNLPENSPIVRINFAPRENSPSVSGPVAPQRSEGSWPMNRWLLFTALILTAHVAAIFIFGEYKLPARRPIINAPQFQLANNSRELLTQADPTLFALPHGGDLASVGLQIAALEPPTFRWSESPHFLPLPSQLLGAVFQQFMRTNAAQNIPLNFKPAVEVSAPAILLRPAFAKNSTMQIEGDLSQRKLPNKVALTNWPYADVIAPSTVQVVVNADGDVFSAVLLPSNNPLKNEMRYDAADQRALEIARGLRFAPAPHLTVGNIIFNWRTVPPPETNSLSQ